VEDLLEFDHKKLEIQFKQELVRSGLFKTTDGFSLSVETAAEYQVRQLPLIEPIELEEALARAKLFLEDRVFMPALRWGRAAQGTVNLVRDTRQWISRFEKIGDLIRYMDRFKPEMRQLSFGFTEIKHIRFEDVYADFVREFDRYRGFITTISDFKEGDRYGGYALSIFTRTYSNRGAGIRPVGKLGKHHAVVVNITIGGGKYPNEWLEPGRRLKCYLKAPINRGENRHEENNEANRSIMHFPHVPVLVFARNQGERDYRYYGVFRYAQIPADEGGKWFDLMKVDAQH
jgi:5-methylcytosine-specific restriction protein A